MKVAVGAGNSVYTAGMAFGFVRRNPGLALNPKMWAIPLVIGLTLIIWRQTPIRPAQKSSSTVQRPSSDAVQA